MAHSGGRRGPQAGPHRALVQAEFDAYLEALRAGATYKAAAEMAGRTPSAFWRWRQTDEDFAEQVRQAVDEGADLLEAEAIRRARDGVEKGIYYQGRRVAVEREFSDQLLMFLLKGKRPDVYRDNSRVESSGPNGNPIRVEVTYDDNTAARILGGLVQAGVVLPGPAALTHSSPN